MKPLLSDLTEEQLAEELSAMNLPTYRLSQVRKWAFSGVDYDGMTNIPKNIRTALAEKYDCIGAEIINEARSQDGTIKFLFRLRDGNLIEGVLMTYKYGHTLCVSTQVGCRMNCAFCASGKDGLERNLTAGEMLAEVMCADNFLRRSGSDGRVGNVVLMGSGEPMDNYENVSNFIKLLGVYGIGQRSISISTCGLTEGIRRLADDGFSVTLCLSLHSPFDEKRVTVMPTGKKYKVSDIISSAKYYFEKSGRRVIVEYAMMRGFNISDADAKELRKLTSSFPCHINLIPLNATGSNLVGVNRKESEEFMKKLTALGASATIRRSLGEDIEGACGQLKRKYTENRR